MTNVQTILLENNQGMLVEILNFGARIKSIVFPVKGKATQMTVGYENAEDYLTDTFYLGATCGRVCNRIEGGKFTLNGINYPLNQNENEHCLHGGEVSFASRFWQISSSSKSTVTLTLVSEHGDQGFPGQLNLQVKYHLTDDNQLEIDYFGKTDAPTPVSVTNHAYFNLGNDSAELLDLQIAASNMLERKENGLPSGNILSVKNSDFDFREPFNIGERQANNSDVNLKKMACYDHCYVLDEDGMSTAKATLVSKNTGVKMSLFTNQPALQLYTGVALSGEFTAYQGVCLEAQHYSNAVNISHFPSSILLPNDEYKRKIIYQFECL
ncbi:aldose epimerase family protein [Thalassotalea piscium]